MTLQKPFAGGSNCGGAACSVVVKLHDLDP